MSLSDQVNQNISQLTQMTGRTGLMMSMQYGPQAANSMQDALHNGASMVQQGIPDTGGPQQKLVAENVPNSDPGGRPAVDYSPQELDRLGEQFRANGVDFNYQHTPDGGVELNFYAEDRGQLSRSMHDAADQIEPGQQQQQEPQQVTRETLVHEADEAAQQPDALDQQQQLLVQQQLPYDDTPRL